MQVTRLLRFSGGFEPMAWKSMLSFLACALIVISCAYVLYDLNGDSLDFSDSEVVLIVTASMDGNVEGYDVDSFPADTLAIIKNMPAHEVCFIRVGQVAVYYKDDMMITHRVVGVDTKHQILTVKGDNVSVEEKIDFDDVVGVVAGTNHYLGSALSFIRTNPIQVIGLLGVIIACAAVYSLRDHIPKIERKGIGRGVAYTMAFAAVAGIVLVGAGYAYTASTENTGNDVTSEYVVLVQSNYTLVDDGKFDYYSMTGSDSITRYCIIDYEGTRVQKLVTDTECKLGPKPLDYWGVKIGGAELSMSKTGLTDNYLVVKLEMNSDEDHYFTTFDKSRAQWKYFMKIYYVEEETEKDVHWLGSDGVNWYAMQKAGDSDNCVKLDSSKTYNTDLYFGGPDVTFGGKHYAGSAVKPQGDGGSAKIIKDGRIKFVFDGSPTISFDKNNAGATGSMENQVVSYNKAVYLNENGFSLTDYTFSKWNTKPDGSGTDYSNEGAITIDRDTTLYAIWVSNV